MSGEELTAFSRLADDVGSARQVLLGGHQKLSDQLGESLEDFTTAAAERPDTDPLVVLLLKAGEAVRWNNFAPDTEDPPVKAWDAAAAEAGKRLGLVVLTPAE